MFCTFSLPLNEVWGNLMFFHLSVILLTEGGLCVSQHVMGRGVCDQGVCDQGVCDQGVCDQGTYTLDSPPTVNKQVGMHPTGKGMHGRGACVAGGMHGRGCAWQGDMHGKGAGMVGECVARGVHGRECVTGMHGSWHAWQGGICGRRDGHCSGRYASFFTT